MAAITADTRPTDTDVELLFIEDVVRQSRESKSTVERGIRLYRESGGLKGLRHFRRNDTGSKVLRTRVVIDPEDLARWRKGEDPRPPGDAPQAVESRQSRRGGVPARQRTRKPSR